MQRVGVKERLPPLTMDSGKEGSGAHIWRPELGGDLMFKVEVQRCRQTESMFKLIEGSVFGIFQLVL